MAYDRTTIETQLTALQTAITAALTNPRPNWKVGQVWMDHGDYLKILFAQQKELIEQLKSFPHETVTTHQDWVTPFGQDMTEYHEEPN